MISDKSKTYMQMAYELALQAQEQDEVPIGAIVVSRETDTVIGAGFNQTITLSDPTAHAEIMAIRQACELQQSQRLHDCDLYVTLEPCAMCAAAISFARVKTLYYGASDIKSGGVDQGPKIYDHATIHHKPEIIKGIMADECGQLLTDFFKNKRAK